MLPGRAVSAAGVFVTVLLVLLHGSASAQGVLPAFGRPAPTFGALGESGPTPLDTVSVSSSMLERLLPPIPNLRGGVTYTLGQGARQTRGFADYVLPIPVGTSAVVFGEAHGEYQSFPNPQTASVRGLPAGTSRQAASYRVDLSIGVGYRRIIAENTFFGVNAFHDSTRLFGQWFSSGGLGLELAAKTGGNSMVDITFNRYGQLFSRQGFVNAWRNGRGSYDVEAGYSQGILNDTLDLRLKLAGYQFDVVNKVYGWRAGVDLTTRDGVLQAKYEYGFDRLNTGYHSITAAVNVGFSLENLFSGRSPFSMPSPVFKSPRNLTHQLSQPANRNWNQPGSVVLVNQAGGGSRRQLELVDIIDSGIPGGSTFTADVPNKRWTLSGLAGISPADAFIVYTVRVSDGSLTTLLGLLAPAPAGVLVANDWTGTGTQSAGPEAMTASPQDLSIMATFGDHHVNTAFVAPPPVDGTVVISSTEADIDPLVITFSLIP